MKNKYAIVGHRLMVPTFPISSQPRIKLSDIMTRRFHILDRAQYGNSYCPSNEELFNEAMKADKNILEDLCGLKRRSRLTTRR